MDKLGSERNEKFGFEFTYEKEQENTSSSVDSKVFKKPIEKSGFPYWIFLLLIVLFAWLLYFRKKKASKKDVQNKKIVY